jgi:hypothetical protein
MAHCLGWDMKSLSGTLLFGLLLALAGCGGSGIGNVAQDQPGTQPPSTPATPGTPNVTGPLDENWFFEATMDHTLWVHAALHQEAGSISGTAFVEDFVGCFMKLDPVTQSSGFALQTLVGTVDAQNQVTMTSVSFNGQVITMTGTLSSDKSAITKGSFSIANGCANGKNGQIAGKKYHSLTGTYSGVLTRNGDQFTTTMQLMQAPIATNGYFVLSGEVTIAGPNCSEDWPIAYSFDSVWSSNVIGKRLDARTSGPVFDTDVSGFTDPDAMNLDVESYPYTDSCTIGAAGTLHRQ